MQNLLITLWALILLLPTVAAKAAPAGWETDVERAFELAAESDRMLLVDLYADWCGWCRVLERKVFATPEFKTFAKDFVLLYVDVEDGAAGTELQSRYGGNSLPTVLILTPKRAQAGAINGFQPTAEFITSVHRQLQRYEKFLNIYESTRKSDDLSTLQQLAETLHGQSDGRRAAVVYRRVGELVQTGSKADAWVHYMLADAHRLDRSWPQATAAIGQAHQLASKIGHKDLSERVELLQYQIAREAGDCLTAKTTLERFLRQHPASSHSRRAQRALNLIKSGNDSRCT